MAQAQDDNPVVDAQNVAVTELVANTHADDLLSHTDQTSEDAQAHILNALRVIGPQVMDDSVKYGVIRTLIGVLRTIDIERTIGGSGEIPEEFRYGLSETQQHLHYHPLGEIPELDDPTYEALAERYSAVEALHKPTDEAPIVGYQLNLASALGELRNVHFAGKDEAKQSIIAAMATLDRTHNPETYVSGEIKPETMSVEWQEDDIEYDALHVSVSLR